MPSITDAYEFAEERHNRHKDRSGNLYFVHVNSVFLNTVAILGIVGHLLTDEEKTLTIMLALFHDIVEEHAHTGVTVEVLREHGYPEVLIEWVLRLTHRPSGTSYQENIDLMITQRVWPVIIVKAADNENNLDVGRLAGLKPEEQSIQKRYNKSLLKLVVAIELFTQADYPLGIGRRLREQVTPYEQAEPA